MRSAINNSRAAQRHRLLNDLRRKSITTIYARDELNILHPPGRVRELRLMGYEIVTSWVWAKDHEGRGHRVGLYTLVSSKGVE